MITHAVMGHLLWLCYSNTNKVYAVTKRGFFIGVTFKIKVVKCISRPSWKLLIFYFGSVSTILAI